MTTVYQQNQAAARNIKQRLWQGVREVTQRATMNVVGGFILGTKHDSSNAAFNWHLGLDGDSGYKFYKGIRPVGNVGDSRTDNDSYDIQVVMHVRIERETEALKKHLFAHNFTGKMPRFADFTLVNHVDDEDKLYAEYALLESAEERGSTHREWDLGISTYGPIYL